MNKLLNKLPIKGEFAKNALILTLGTSVAQAFPILFYPILGRIFSPTDFGLLATITSITAILTIISTGKYEASILIAKTNKEAVNIIGLVLLLSFSFLFLSFIFLEIFSDQLSVLMNSPNLEKWLFVPAISGFSIVIFNCYNEWCVRNKYFVNLSWNKIINSSANTLSKLFFGLVKYLSGGLILGDILGRIISACGCVYKTIKKDKDIFFQISFREMKLSAKRYINFPKIYLPGQLLNTVGGQIPILLIAILFNSYEVGLFSMTMNVLSIPISVISLAINDTFRQKANEEYIIKGQCRDIFLKMFKLLSVFSIIGVMILFFILPKIFELVLGNQWIKAGEYSQILIFMIAFSFISNSLGSVLIIAEKLKISLLWQIYYFAISCGSILLGKYIFNNIESTLYFYSIGMITVYLLQIILNYIYSDKRVSFTI